MGIDAITAWLTPRATGAVRGDLLRFQLIVLVGTASYLVYIARWGLGGYWPIVLWNTLAVLANGGVVLFGRTRTKAACIRKMAHGALAANTVVFAGAIALTGGPDSGTHYFFPVLALFAYLQLGIRGGLVWTFFLAIATFGARYIPSAEGVPTPTPGVFDANLDQALALLVIGILAGVSRRVRDVHVIELEAARTAALAAVHARERFVANVSHELRTPLAGSLGTARLLLEELPEGATRQKVETITRCSERLEELLDDVIDHVALREGKLGLRDVPFDPVEIADSTLDLFRAQAEAKGLGCRREGSAPRVFGDPRRMRQVLGNLVANALKFTDQGEIVIKVSHSGAKLKYEVCDTGIGLMHPEKVLEPFEQDDVSISQRFGGTGLGLAICKSLLERMGGGLSLESQPRFGTVASAWVHAPLARTDGTSRNVLVVEDNETNATVTLAMLRHLGHEAVVAPTAEDALSSLEDKHFDVVLLDLRLPGLDGFQLFRSIQSDFGDRRPRVVALSANVEEHDSCLAAGMDGFVAKPCKLEELAGALTA